MGLSLFLWHEDEFCIPHDFRCRVSVQPANQVGYVPIHIRNGYLQSLDERSLKPLQRSQPLNALIPLMLP